MAPMTYPHCLEGCTAGCLMPLRARQKAAAVRRAEYSTGKHVMFSESMFDGNHSSYRSCKTDSAKTPSGERPPVSSAPGQTSSTPDEASAKSVERLVSQGRSQSNSRFGGLVLFSGSPRTNTFNQQNSWVIFKFAPSQTCPKHGYLLSEMPAEL